VLGMSLPLLSPDSSNLDMGKAKQYCELSVKEPAKNFGVTMAWSTQIQTGFSFAGLLTTFVTLLRAQFFGSPKFWWLYNVRCLGLTRRFSMFMLVVSLLCRAVVAQWQFDTLCGTSICTAFVASVPVKKLSWLPTIGFTGVFCLMIPAYIPVLATLIFFTFLPLVLAVKMAWSRGQAPRADAGLPLLCDPQETQSAKTFRILAERPVREKIAVLEETWNKGLVQEKAIVCGADQTVASDIYVSRSLWQSMLSKLQVEHSTRDAQHMAAQKYDEVRECNQQEAQDAERRATQDAFRDHWQSYDSVRMPPCELRCNRAFVLAAVRLNGKHLQYAARELIGDREIVLAAVQQFGGALESATEELKGDREIVFAAVQQFGTALFYAAVELKGDREIVLAALQRDGRALCHAAVELQRDREIVLAAVQQNASALSYAAEELKGDRKIVVAAVEQNGLAFQFAAEELKRDREMALAAVQENGGAFEDAAEELKDDREIVLAAVQQFGGGFVYAAVELKGDREFVLAAVQQNASALFYAAVELKGDREIVLADREIVLAAKELKRDGSLCSPPCRRMGESWRTRRKSSNATGSLCSPPCSSLGEPWRTRRRGSNATGRLCSALCNRMGEPWSPRRRSSRATGRLCSPPCSRMGEPWGRRWRSSRATGRLRPLPCSRRGEPWRTQRKSSSASRVKYTALAKASFASEGHAANS